MGDGEQKQEGEGGVDKVGGKEQSGGQGVDERAKAGGPGCARVPGSWRRRCRRRKGLESWWRQQVDNPWGGRRRNLESPGRRDRAGQSETAQDERQVPLPA